MKYVLRFKKHMKIKSIKEIKNLKGKNILVRVDCNVPLNDKGQIVEDYKIKSSLPTIRHLLIKGANVILLSHLGRPDGKVDKRFSNQVVAKRISKLLEKKVTLLDELVSEKNIETVKNLGFRQIVMLENVRFSPAEKKNDQAFAKNLAKLGDYYVNDAFAVSHRAEASVSAITRYLPSYAGLLLEKEIKYLSKVLLSKVKPKVAIIGGAKIETKVPVIKNMIKKMDYVLIGGAIANTILKAMDYEVGLSKIDDHHLKTATQIIHPKLLIPIDVVVAKDFSSKAKAQVKAVGQIGAKDVILDLGPDTIKLYSDIIKDAKLVVWNGPLGYFGVNRYKKASQAIARAIINCKDDSIIGGGETVQLAKELGLKKKFDFVSTGGGAMLEFLEGKVLAGIKPLLK